MHNPLPVLLQDTDLGERFLGEHPSRLHHSVDQFLESSSRLTLHGECTASVRSFQRLILSPVASRIRRKRSTLCASDIRYRFPIVLFREAPNSHPSPTLSVSVFSRLGSPGLLLNSLQIFHHHQRVNPVGWRLFRLPGQDYQVSGACHGCWRLNLCTFFLRHPKVKIHNLHLKHRYDCVCHC
jgi:hypothetical protein